MKKLIWAELIVGVPLFLGLLCFFMTRQAAEVMTLIAFVAYATLAMAAPYTVRSLAVPCLTFICFIVGAGAFLYAIRHWSGVSSAMAFALCLAGMFCAERFVIRDMSVRRRSAYPAIAFGVFIAILPALAWLSVQEPEKTSSSYSETVHLLRKT